MADKPQSQWPKALGLGMETAVGVVLGYFIGRWLDVRWQTHPKGELIGAGIGFAGGIYLLAKQALKADKEDK